MKKIWLSDGIIVMICTIALFSCEKNHTPEIQKFNCSPSQRKAGTIFSLSVTATDEDGDIPDYQWTADGGEFPGSTNGSQTKWKSPTDGRGKTFNIDVSVSDGKEVVDSSYLRVVMF